MLNLLVLALEHIWNVFKKFGVKKNCTFGENNVDSLLTVESHVM